MADYTTPQTAIEAALNNGLVEEYEARNDSVRVKRGTAASQIDALARLEGLAARRSGGMFRVAKMQEPTD
ncbi:hypothetical protein [Gimesia maris]|uniref:hypothetical protein n=1 Tax=Gimesia maris TaxID=122 RepID=UPI0032F08F52